MKPLLILLFCLPLFSLAQNTPLVIEGASPKFYLTHTVQAKENYYSVGRMYNISPKEIAPFNNLQLEKGLSLNQVIKVPLMEVNFLQGGNATADEVLVPIYHKVKEKEGLYRIAVNYNNLPLETLKQWNNIKGEAVANGTNLIIGYLKVKTALSPLASMAKAKPAENNIKEQPVVKKEPKPAVNNDLPTVVKEPVPAPAPPKKEAVLVKEPEPVSQPVVTTAASKNFNGGFFKKDYEKQAAREGVVNVNGAAAIFKSNSGWEDGKYYCLYNTATPGTIIKVTCTSTGKTVYAKVLDVIPDIKQNNGLLIRISNAAAQELGVGESRFDCTLTYSK
jgi:LysM repeat protein